MIQYYEHSAQKGSVDAQLTLGHLNFHGARVGVDRLTVALPTVRTWLSAPVTRRTLTRTRAGPSCR